jgi:hypothetical protein
MPNKEFRPTLIEILEAQQALAESLFDLEAADAMLIFTSGHFLNVKVMRLINALDLDLIRKLCPPSASRSPRLPSVGEP